jgi:hypothetical protein
MFGFWKFSERRPLLFQHLVAKKQFPEIENQNINF